ncbi:recombinase family protein [Neomicrococcus lactis]
MNPLKTAIVYARVSTEEQASNGASLEAQVMVLSHLAQIRGWNVVIMSEQASGKSMSRTARPILNEALDMLSVGEADYLLAVRIDRISRSVEDFAGLMGRSRRESWAMVLSEMDLDTTTSQGEFMANVQVSVAQYERRLIGDRTREGLAQRKREGVKLGRRTELTTAVVQRIKTERRAGATLTAIAHGLTEDGIPTAQGGVRWYPATVKKILESEVWAHVP